MQDREVRLQVDASQLRQLAAVLTEDARELQPATVPVPEASEVGHRRLADALHDFAATADTGVESVAHAAQALADWMRLAADIALADDAAIAAQFGTPHASVVVSPQPIAAAAAGRGAP